MPKIETEELEVIHFTVGVDLETVAWLCDVANSCHASPAAVIASLLRDIRVDDQQAHEEPEPPATLN